MITFTQNSILKIKNETFDSLPKQVCQQLKLDQVNYSSSREP